MFCVTMLLQLLLRIASPFFSQHTLVSCHDRDQEMYEMPASKSNDLVLAIKKNEKFCDSELLCGSRDNKQFPVTKTLSRAI